MISEPDRLSESVNQLPQVPQNVRELQTLLQEKGYDPGPVDGKVGYQTTDALLEWLNGLPSGPTPNDGMKLSRQGRELIEEFEGLFLESYQDSAGVWTIGWGHTGLKHRDGTVYPGRRITPEEADQLLAHDMEKFEDRVKRLVAVPLTQNEFDALVSFDFNTGGLARSSLLQRLNRGDMKRSIARSEFIRWINAGGRPLRGLARRRASEAMMFTGHTNPIITDSTMTIEDYKRMAHNA